MTAWRARGEHEALRLARASGCLTTPGVLTLYAIALLAALPLVLRLHLEADVRNTLPPDMARALERHNALFGTADLAFLLVQTSPGGRDHRPGFGAALHERLTNSPLIRSVEYGYAPELFEVLDRLSLEYAPALRHARPA